MTSPYQKDAYTLEEVAKEYKVDISQLEYWIAKEIIGVCVRIFDRSLKIYRVEGVSRSNSYSTATPNQLFRVRYPVSNIIYQLEIDHVVSTVHREPDAHSPLKPLFTELDLHPDLYINKKDLLISHFEKERFKTAFLHKINPELLPIKRGRKSYLPEREQLLRDLLVQLDDIGKRIGIPISYNELPFIKKDIYKWLRRIEPRDSKAGFSYIGDEAMDKFWVDQNLCDVCIGKGKEWNSSFSKAKEFDSYITGKKN